MAVACSMIERNFTKVELYSHVIKIDTDMLKILCNFRTNVKHFIKTLWAQLNDEFDDFFVLSFGSELERQQLPIRCKGSTAIITLAVDNLIYKGAFPIEEVQLNIGGYPHRYCI